MIYFLTTRRHSYTMGICLRTDGKALAPIITQVSYGVATDWQIAQTSLQSDTHSA